MSTVLDARFELLGARAVGATATVFDAVDRSTGAACVVKVLLPGSMTDATLVARFQREVRLMAAAPHPHAMPLLGYGTTAQGAPYLALPHLPGELLSDRLVRGPLSPEDAVAHSRGILSFLSAIHGLGFVHRDLKPDNLWLERRGTEDVIRVFDFGVAGYVDGVVMSMDDAGLTPPHVVMGTPRFLPPERRRGEGAAAGADLYATAVTLYMMLTGADPFDDLHDRASGPAPMGVHGMHVPSWLGDVVERALSPVPSERYATATAFAVALRPH